MSIDKGGFFFHRSYMLIGEILIRNKAATTPQVDEALRKKEGKERLGQALIRLGFVKEDDVLRALSEQTQIPYLDLTGIEIDATLSNPGSMKTIFQHAPRSRAAGAFRRLAEEVVERHSAHH